MMMMMMMMVMMMREEVVRNKATEKSCFIITKKDQAHIKTPEHQQTKSYSCQSLG
jgi:hypothetical protein